MAKGKVLISVKGEGIISPSSIFICNFVPWFMKTTEKKAIFEVVYPKEETLFNIIEINSRKESNKCFLRRKRIPDGRSNKDRLDNIRVKIKRGFFNYALL